MERTKRKTAGRRMGALVGKALEQDDAFWSHETWAEDADSGNESFHDSDEDSANKKDEFDSDFDDSESDHEEEEREAGLEAERELKRAERSNQQKSKVYKDIANAGRAMMQKKKAKGSRRVVGDGMNAGIVLNFPPPAANGSAPPAGQALPAAASAPASSSSASSKKSSSKSRDGYTLASTRERRSQQMLKRLRENRSTAPCESHKKIPRPSATKKAKRRRYGQEELILEAIHETEPENRRWMLARKRVQDLADQDKDALSARDRNKGKIVQKYHSRRGCLNTLTFPEMDYVPDVLTRSSSAPPKPDPSVCVITGKPAKYRDPQTKLGYYDLEAFKELRRRQEAGEPLDQRPKAADPPAAVSTNVTDAPVDSAKISPALDINVSGKQDQQIQEVKESTPACVPTTTKATTAKATSTKVDAKAAATKSTQKAAEKKSGSTTGQKKPSLKRQTSAGSTKSAAKKDNKNAPSKVTKTPDTTKTVVSANSATKMDVSPVSPSGTRQSGRKWKPSAKLLENITNSGEQKKGALALGIHLRPQLSNLTAPQLQPTAPADEQVSPLPAPTSTGMSAVASGTTAPTPKTETPTAQGDTGAGSASAELDPGATSATIMPSLPAHLPTLPSVTVPAPASTSQSNTGLDSTLLSKPMPTPTSVPPSAMTLPSSVATATATAAAGVASSKKAPTKARGKKEESAATAKKAGKTAAKPKISTAQKKKSNASEKASKSQNGSSKGSAKTARGKKESTKSRASDTKPPNPNETIQSGDANFTGHPLSDFGGSKAGLEKVYMIPEDESSNGNHQPRFITQSELIMAAITNYHKSKEEKK